MICRSLLLRSVFDSGHSTPVHANGGGIPKARVEAAELRQRVPFVKELRVAHEHALHCT
jgi:hypothetical protein